MTGALRRTSLALAAVVGLAAVGFFGFGEIPEFGHRFLHEVSYHFPRIFRMKSKGVSRFYFCYFSQFEIPSVFP